MLASPILVCLTHPIAARHERPPVAAPREAVERELHAAASREGIPYGLVRAVAVNESALVSTAVSRTGAVGVMQIEPEVASDCGIANRYDVHANVVCGARLLRHLLARYAWDIRRAVAAYNFGPAAVDRVHRRHGEPPETKRYVANVLAMMRENKE
jgi:soluble lytic murein transglycosylase-like protein